MRLIYFIFLLMCSVSFVNGQTVQVVPVSFQSPHFKWDKTADGFIVTQVHWGTDHIQIKQKDTGEYPTSLSNLFHSGEIEIYFRGMVLQGYHIGEKEGHIQECAEFPMSFKSACWKSGGVLNHIIFHGKVAVRDGSDTLALYHYTSGMRDGICWEVVDEPDLLGKMEQYSYGFLHGVCNYDYQDGSSKMQVYDIGTLLYEKEYDANGNLRRSKVNYESEITFDEQGRRKSVLTAVDSRLFMEIYDYIEYDTNGVARVIGTKAGFKEQLACLTWRWYDEKGKLTRTEYISDTAIFEPEEEEFIEPFILMKVELPQLKISQDSLAQLISNTKELKIRKSDSLVCTVFVDQNGYLEFVNVLNKNKAVSEKQKKAWVSLIDQLNFTRTRYALPGVNSVFNFVVTP